MTLGSSSPALSEPSGRLGSQSTRTPMPAFSTGVTLSSRGRIQLSQQHSLYCSTGRRMNASRLKLPPRSWSTGKLCLNATCQPTQQPCNRAGRYHALVDGIRSYPQGARPECIPSLPCSLGFAEQNDTTECHLLLRSISLEQVLLLAQITVPPMR